MISYRKKEKIRGRVDRRRHQRRDGFEEVERSSTVGVKEMQEKRFGQSGEEMGGGGAM